MTKAQKRRDKLRQRAKQAVTTREQKGLGKKSALDWGRLVKTKPSVFSPTAGKDKNLIDILPFEITQSWYRELRTFSGLTTNLDVGDWDYKLEVPVHKGIGENNDTVLCLRLAFGQKCPICEDLFAEYEKEEPDPKVTQALRPSWRDYFNIFDYNEEEKDLQVWEDVSYHLFEKTVLEEADEGDNWILYSDIEIGKSIQFKGVSKKLGKSSFTETQSVEFQDREAYEENVVNDTISFDALLKIPTYEDVARIHLGLDNDTTETVPVKTPETTDEKPSPPRRRGRKPAPIESEPEPEPVESEQAPKETAEDTCPQGKKFGVDCDPATTECQDCDENIFQTCADKLDAITDAAVEPEPEKPKSRKRRPK